MAHEIKMGDDGILQVKMVGDVDQEGWAAYAQDIASILDTLPETETVHFLVDLRQMGKSSLAARKDSLDIFRNPDPRIGKSALVGANRYIQVLGSFVMSAAGRDDFRFFDSEDEALAWLASGA